MGERGGSQVQKKIRQKIQSRKVQVRREEFGEEGLGFSSDNAAICTS